MASRPDVKHPLISVITPTLNQGLFIEEAILSVLKQNYAPFEHIVIDGGSTDTTVEILKRYSHLRWISEKDQGQSDALNKGLRMAKGEIIAWLNSDDCYADGAFHRVAEASRAYPGEKVWLGDCTSFVHGSTRLNYHPNKPLGFEDLIRYWDGWNPPTQPSIFFKAELIKEFGAFDPGLHRAMDYDFWLRISQKYRFIYIPEVLSLYRLHPDSKSGLGTEWSSFYPEWHQVYLRYKSLSRVLPQKPMITVAIPLRADDRAEDGHSPDTVRDFIGRLQKQRFRDMEILLISGEDSPADPAGFSDAPIPVRMICIPQLSRAAFYHATRDQARGFALHIPRPNDIIPDQWYAQALDLLLDNPELRSVSDVSLEHPAGSETAGDPGSFELWRLDAFQPACYDVSVIIPTCNRSDVLQRCLDALSSQSVDPAAFEVLVADDGSTDETRAIVQEYKAPYRLTYLYQEPGGPAAARNLAIRQSLGKYILILNDDAISASHLLENHLKAHAKLGNAQAAVLGSFPFHRDNVDTVFMQLMQTSKFAFQYAQMTAGNFYDWRYFWTCNISLNRSALQQAGLFDEGFRHPAGEDTELGYRLWKKGYRVFYDPSCEAEHAHTLRLYRFCQRQVMVGKHQVLLCLKHPELTRDVTGGSTIQEAAEEASQWLSANEHRVLESLKILSEADREKIDWSRATGIPSQTTLQRLEKEFLIINKYWIYQGLLQGWGLHQQLSQTGSPARDEKSLRITFVVPGTALSGGTRVVFEYCNRLAGNGHHITLVSLTADKPDWFPLSPAVRYVNSGWDDRRLSYDLPDADFVFATQWSTAYYVARLPSSKGRKYYLIQSYESATITTPESADPTYILPLGRIAVSSWLREELQRRFGARATVIPNGIDLQAFFPDVPARRNDPEKDFRIGMLYHPEPRKGFPVGLESFRIIKENIPEAKLILFGTSRPAQESGWDEFHQNIAGEQVRALYNSLDVFLSTSEQEGFGLPGLEALACGTLLVTTDSGGVREYAINGETALVCPPGNSEALANAVLRLRQDSTLRDKLRTQGLEKAKEFGWTRPVQAMESLLFKDLNEPDAGFREAAGSSAAARPAHSAQFYSRPSTAPLRLRLLWKVRDRLQGWKLRSSYLLARRFK